MRLSDVMSNLAEGLGRALPGIAPEIALVVTIILLLLVRLFQRSPGSNLSGLAICGSLVALLLAVLQLLNIVGVSALTDPSAGVLGTPAARLARLASTAGAGRMPGSISVTASGTVLSSIAEASGLGSGAQAKGSVMRPDETVEQPATQDIPLSQIPEAVTGLVRSQAPDLVLESAVKYEHPTHGIVYRVHGYRVHYQDDQPTDLFIGAGGDTVGGRSAPAARAGMLRFDSFTIFFRIFLMFFLFLVIWLTKLTGIPDNEDSPDFYTLLLGATLGMSLMVSSNHLLMVLIAVEMASLPSYGMAGFLKGRREASEASLKYVVFGAGASGIMLYGISLLVGKFGTAHLPTLAQKIAEADKLAEGGGPGGVLLLGLLLVLVGLAFKISAVPFHFWCPDVFEGAAAEVAAFLSVASKGAALGLLARITTSLILPRHPQIELYWGGVIALLAAITATYGNLAAYAQTNLKRLLAFSTIAHAGYMMMPLAAFVTMSRQSPAAGQPALEALTFYLLIYLFMNLGAFAVVALIRNQIRSEDLKDYGGLIRRSPFLTVAMAVFMLSLTGIPPLAGFAAKFRIFAVLYEANLHWLLAIGLANTVFSLFYYMKVLRVMILDEPLPNAPGWTVAGGIIVYCTVLIAANLAVMLVPGTWDAMDSLVQLAVPHLLGSY